MSVSKTLMAATAVAALLAGSAYAGAAGHYHIFRPTSFKNLAAHVPPPAGDMFYYGGSVFSSSKVVSVIWNKDVLQNTKDQVPLFTAAIVDSTYVDQAKEYSTKHVTPIN